MDKKEFFESIDKGITIVDFFANWCAPCKGQATIFNYLKENNDDSNTKFLKFDLDNDDHTVASNFEIRSIPTIIIFLAGQEEFRFVGLTGADELIKAMDESKRKFYEKSKEN